MTQVAIRLGVVAAVLLVLVVIKSNGLAATFGIRSPRRPSISALLATAQKCNFQLRPFQL